MSNDNEGPPQDPVKQSARDAASDAALKRIMPALLPKLHAVFDHIREYGLDDPEVAVKTYAPVAAVYRLWHDASVEALTRHYHQFEQPLTIVDREDELPHAAKEFAEDLTGLNEQEAIVEYIAAQDPPMTLQQVNHLHDAFAAVKRKAVEIDTTGVTSFTARRIKDDSGPSGPGGL